MAIRDLSDSEDEHVVFPGDSFTSSGASSTKDGTDDLSDRKYTPTDVSSITEFLLSKEIPCFVVGSAALRYYGCRLVLSFVAIAVPASIHRSAIEELDQNPDLISLGIKDAWAPSGPSLTFSEFKLKGTTLSILLVPDLAWGLRCESSNIHIDSDTRIPYPTVAHLAQSLLRTRDVNCLELLVDGQDCSLDWGIEHLEFGEHSWKRAVWEKAVVEKQKRIPREKPLDLYATRFRRKKVDG